MPAVAFDVPVEVAFDYLVDPRNRPQWQPSLRRVDSVDGAVGVGQRWIDVTVAGVRPEMETTALDRPVRWTERGRWRALSATLTLTFAPAPTGCRVEADFDVEGRGPARPLGPALAFLARAAVPGDLRRAARILSERATEH